VQDVRRLYSEFMNNQLRSSTAVNSDAQTYLTQVNQVDSLLSDSTGLSSVMQKFFASCRLPPAVPPMSLSRQLVLTQAGNLAQRFNSISTQLGTQNSYVNTQMESIAGQVTDLAKTIAQYNQAITAASASGANPNDLLDKRDQAVAQAVEHDWRQRGQAGQQLQPLSGVGAAAGGGQQVGGPECRPERDQPRAG
jgi:flagellar hook-associated protein 1 FlgK